MRIPRQWFGSPGQRASRRTGCDASLRPPLRRGSPRHLVRAATLGLLLGWAAWGENRAPLLALLLPFLVATRASRHEAALIAAGYALGLLRLHGAFVARWFADDAWLGGGVMLICACITSAVWSFGWSAAASGLARAMRMLTAWLLALLPPAALAAPGHPLVAIGYMLPSTGWCGVAASALLAAAAGYIGPRRPASIANAFMCTAAIVLAGTGVSLAHVQNARQPQGIVGMTTHWGALQGVDDALARLQRMGVSAKRRPSAIVLWPESVIGRYEPGMQPVLELELLQASRRGGETQVVGMDLAMPDGRLMSAAVAFRPDGSIETAVARQPAPLALWRPWLIERTFVADWGASNMLRLDEANQAAVIFCYEEYVPVMYLINELRNRPTLYFAIANTWAAPSNAAAIQTWHSLGMARLFGRSYYKAENRESRESRDARGEEPDAWLLAGPTKRSNSGSAFKNCAFAHEPAPSFPSPRRQRTSLAASACRCLPRRHRLLMLTVARR
ncbi:MAG: hypothetical protein JWQ76_5390 [Ramlibacter sp.]|nr:hypothetical protein [Ramlibacter sp.]